MSVDKFLTNPWGAPRVVYQVSGVVTAMCEHTCITRGSVVRRGSTDPTPPWAQVPGTKLLG